MSVDLGKRLVELRINGSMTQDELAAKANIDRRKIALWERGKDSPDGEELIRLSQVYEMPIDEILLNFDTDGSYNSDNIPEKTVKSAGIIELKRKKSYNWYAFPYPILVLIIYLGIGAIFGVWHPTWILFLTIPVYYQMVTVNRLTSFTAKANVFPYPIIVSILYLALGFDYGIWHPSWLMFLTIPVYYMTIAWLGNKG